MVNDKFSLLVVYTIAAIFIYWKIDTMPIFVSFILIPYIQFQIKTNDVNLGKQEEFL